MDGHELQFDGGMGIEATVPFGNESDFLRPVYPVHRVKPEDFFTKEDIENARSRMVGQELCPARAARYVLGLAHTRPKGSIYSAISVSTRAPASALRRSLPASSCSPPRRDW